MKIILIALLLTGCATVNQHDIDDSTQNSMAANPNPYVFVNVSYRAVARFFKHEEEKQ